MDFFRLDRLAYEGFSRWWENNKTTSCSQSTKIRSLPTGNEIEVPFSPSVTGPS